MSNVLNIIQQILAYSDGVTTDNPQLRMVDWSRKFSNISTGSVDSNNVKVLPGQSYTLFDGIRSNPLNSTSILSLLLIRDSIYKIVVTAGAAGFRTARTIAPLTDCNVTVNNDAVATFEFVGATLTGVVPGDVLRVSGACADDPGPYSFSPLNAGKWRVIAVSGNKVQAMRFVGVPFSGVTESVISVISGQVEIYSLAGVQAGDKFEISGAFSPASWRVYEVLDARPNEIRFISAIPLPEETGVVYPDPLISGSSITFYSNAKKLFYLETDQDAIVQFNADTGISNKVSPISAGDPDLVGYLHKYGVCYKAVVINTSMNIANIRFVVAE